MTMDEEMMEPLKGDFVSLEIDLDYEFDAVRYFDLSREETFAEAWEAQLWFESAGSYPPSPFIARLNIGENVLLESINTLSDFKDTETSDNVHAQSNDHSGPNSSVLGETSKVHILMKEDDPGNANAKKFGNANAKKFAKGPFSRGSTLMKPTASQLAKQNRLREVKHTHLAHARLSRPIIQKHKGVMEDFCETGIHASKRQKLEGGHSWKVAGVKEPMDLLHKALQKKSVSADIDPHSSRLRITIPREPELVTAQRAQRQRVQRIRRDDAKQLQEGKTPAIPVFKARPLNRKILEAPSLPLPQKSTPRLPQFQPFHLKTDERALQHSATSSSSLVCKNPFSVSSVQDGAPGQRNLQFQPSGPPLSRNVEQKREGCDSLQTKFKAQPLNKKILSSKGDIGVFRSTKREATKPMEFNFSTSKRCQQDPPTELFDKLSLNNEIHMTTEPNTMVLWPSHGVHKDSKENVNSIVQQGHKDIHVKEELRGRRIKHIESEGSALQDNRSKINKPRICSQSIGIR